MKMKPEKQRVRFPARHGEDGEPFIDLVLEEEEDPPCSEYVVMSHEREMPALQEYLHDLRERDRPIAI